MTGNPNTTGYSGMARETHILLPVARLMQTFGRCASQRKSRSSMTMRRGLRRRFLLALTAGVPVTVFYRYQRSALALAWREWMTKRVMEVKTWEPFPGTFCRTSAISPTYPPLVVVGFTARRETFNARGYTIVG